ncbi:hypothetical protein EDD21DRAFT_354650 [Dissophora ornata]|nr:hypothetical protein EDD21DRAFT_354650 [Dissophora ornata]
MPRNSNSNNTNDNPNIINTTDYSDNSGPHINADTKVDTTNTKQRYRLRVLVGPGSKHEDLRPLNVNDDANPFLIDTDEFVGGIMFRVKGLDQAHGYKEGQAEDGLECKPDSPWFELPVPEHSGANSSGSSPGKNHSLSCVQIVGRFKREWSGDQIVFGSVFDRRLTRLPPFTSVGVKLLHFLDPAIKVDLKSEKPYILSPMVVAMNTVHVSKATSMSSQSPSLQQDQYANPKWPSPNGEHVLEDTRVLFEEETTSEDDITALSPTSPKMATKAAVPKTSKERQHYFAKPKNLTQHKFRTDQEYALEFTAAGSHADFAHFKVRFAGISIDGLKFWDGQPCKFVMRTADASVTFFTLWIEPQPVSSG